MDTKIKEDLAYAYRIIAKLGMDDHTYTLIYPQGQKELTTIIYTLLVIVLMK